ncbi:MAG: DNA-directed RNA polymerase subunit beta [Acidobacteria bacterium]|nr:MAG: DNA-directed RNA polymerase subunit beta [Acidobacteriota bacterium]REJ98839.1 MAG: DNA-directed RNA polymerase subunit beta [Acidobacteriota bacterium]REK16441.1 MAG: DNA-directed RNA polymerase subunit beta [Acidobacteriota bacterium]REK44122.1 MAG: DNA-directed RNA polymerase subunit beta [Acidobacteriota bacterium]
MINNPLQENTRGLGRRTSKAPERVDFSKIQTSAQIPNLIEVQRESYNRFLQMDLIPEERRSVGLQSVFETVFPVSDFRETAMLEFVEYQIGNWQCKCGNLEGLEHLREECKECSAKIKVDPFGSTEVLCSNCGTFNVVKPRLCPNCGEPVGLKHKHDQQECQERGVSFSVPLKVKIRLTVFDKDPDTEVATIRDIKEEEVFFGEIPLMTDNGTFIINGTERVIVSQLHRSPGVFFKRDKEAFSAKIIPYRGSWIEFEYDHKGILHSRLGKRKLLATIFLRALGLWLRPQIDMSTASDSILEEVVKNAEFTNADLLGEFYTVDQVKAEKGKLHVKVKQEGDTSLVGMRSSDAIKSGRKQIVKANKKITRLSLKELRKAKVDSVEIDPAEFAGAYAVDDVVNMETGEVVIESNTEITSAKLMEILEQGEIDFTVCFPERDPIGPILSQTLIKDTINKPVDALLEIYRKMRPGDPPTVPTAYKLVEGMFFDKRRFDLSRVGRLKFNIKLGRPDMEDIDNQLLEARDFLEVVDYLFRMKKDPDHFYEDDIDHLGNRRVRAVGELLENQFRIGLERMERAIKEKMSIQQDMFTTMPRDLVNAKPVTAAVREFFGSSQLSQFMDQTNPLSEITHKRRLSALGPGGLSRERAGFEVRDVHPTHYGRICPIETPEGPNIGLISSLSCFARINEFGFIESPYRKVEDGRVIEYVKVINGGDTSFKHGEHVPLEDVEKENNKLKKTQRAAEFEPYPFYLTAWDEDKYVIGQANIELDEKGKLVNERNAARKAGEFIVSPREEIQYMDVSPKQLVSVAASLIPFLENDDANRALMGSNMQRQSVPLLRAESPYVGTGMEKIAARDSGAVVVARRDGVVDYIDSERIIVKADHQVGGMISREVTADIYSLVKFKRSNQNTCINQRPIVSVGERVKKGQVIADGPCTDKGELALGRNVLVAFMPWRGYNFEDAILVSERLVKEDYYTSIHIEELEVEARDTKLGPEEITRDIPNIGENMLRDLDESGIIRIGAHVSPGSILVGKVTPKGETQLTAEEKLLRAIFGEKAGDVKDASLTAPPGIDGTVVDVQVFTRKGQEKDERSLDIEALEEDSLRRDLEDEIRILTEQRDERIYELFEGYSLTKDLTEGKDVLVKKGTKLTRKNLEDVPIKVLRKASVKAGSVDIEAEINDYVQRTERQIGILSDIYEEKIAKIKQGDELPPGVIKMVKVFVAMKRKLSVGDKMAGRHGNKGVIARILPEEDMPYLPDGTPVDIVLNPLGVPSRMNVGQILETHLGWAGRVLGLHFATPVFDGASEQEIKKHIKMANDRYDELDLPNSVGPSGKTRLYDGLTGEQFEQKVTVGYIYMLKLSHLVDDKIHARSIGPYSLITQQPLGGKAQFGGQRFGEMEVWALEAYGAAHILQELLTCKSDDVAGRSKIYEAIVKGAADFKPGIPESFNVLVRELQSLCLDVELITEDDVDEEAKNAGVEELVGG